MNLNLKQTTSWSKSSQTQDHSYKEIRSMKEYKRSMKEGVPNNSLNVRS